MDSLKEQYASKIAGIFPLHRITYLSIIFTLFCFTEYTTSKDIIIDFLGAKITEFYNFKTGIYSKSVAGDIIATLAVSITAYISSKIILNLIFSPISKKINLEERILKLKSNSFEYEASIYQIKQLEQQLIDTKKKIANYNEISEGILGISIAIVCISFYGSCLDLTIGIVLLFLSTIPKYISILIFLSNFIPISIVYEKITHIKQYINSPPNN